MSSYRVAPHAFIAGGVLYGPGRYAWGAVYDSWKLANSEPTADTSIPPGHAETIQVDGLQAAFDRLATWQRIHS